MLVDLGAGMQAELGQDALGVMAGGVLADAECRGELGVRPAQPQQLRDFELAPGQAERRHRQGARGRRRPGGRHGD